jgi:hypothetical protein
MDGLLQRLATTRRQLSVPAHEGDMKIQARHPGHILLLPLFAASVALLAPAQDSSHQPVLPDSPSTMMAERASVAGPFPGETVTASPSSQAPSSQAQEDPCAIQKPVGTAAAEKPATTGVAASNAAGAAIAPAKQRRMRMLFIKVGAVVGAGVAIGTVAALSTGSPAKPPGSR